MSLQTLRAQIDEIDARLVPLLNERTKAALEIGRLKKKNGEQICVPEREQAVLDHVTGINQGPLSDTLLKQIFHSIIEASKAVEENV